MRSFESSHSGATNWTRLPWQEDFCHRDRVAEGRFFDAPEMFKLSSVATQEMREAGIQSLCCVPLLLRSQALGSLLLGATREDAFSREDGEYLEQVATQIAPAVHNANTYREVAQAKDRLAHEKRYLENEISAERMQTIIGNSGALKRVLDNAAIVANTDATVLITGETGTGKERIARAIHMMSSRRDRNFIKLNCAAIPTGLLESELFGHEKGAFTGAVSQKVGRLELADSDTVLPLPTSFVRIALFFSVAALPFSFSNLIDSTGQASAHFPQPIQASGSIRAIPSTISIAPAGHTPAHNWHPMHLSGIIAATSIPLLFLGTCPYPSQRFSSCRA